MVKIKILTEEDKKKRAKKEKQKEILKKISNRIYKAVILLQIIVIAFIVSTPLFNFASTTLRFSLEEEKFSVALIFQIRSLSYKRYIDYIGKISGEDLKKIKILIGEYFK